MRSMQRGAGRRDRVRDDGPAYADGAKPALRDEDMAHFGQTQARMDQLARDLTPKVLGYAKAGFKKPADVARLLNREHLRTLAGANWNPRIVYFLLARIYEMREEERRTKPRRPPFSSPASSSPARGRASLSATEVERRRIALANAMAPGKGPKF